MQHRAKTTARKKETTTAFTGWLAARPLFTELILTALTTLFGMQVFRVLVPSMFWVLNDRMGWGAIQLGGIGFLLLLTAFLSGPLSRLLGNHRLVVVTAGGLGLVRLFIQVWWNEPLFNSSLAIVGTILFVIFLPTYLENARLRGGPATSRFALGLLVGLALDTAINGAFGTYDTAWQVELLPLLLTLLLVIVQCVLLSSIALASKASLTTSLRTRASGIPISRSLPWLAIGPFIFLQLVVFQNIPRVATLTNWPLPTAFGVTLLAQLAGLAAATWLLSRARHTLWPWALGSGIGLIAILAPYHQKSALLTAVLLIVGQVLISALLVIALIGIGASSKKTQRHGITVANGIGMILLLLFIIAYYAVYKISLPYSNVILEPIAGFIIMACALGVPIVTLREIKANYKVWAVPAIALLLLILPLASMLTWQTPAATTGEGFPIRIMTYNLHNGFNTKGKLNMEKIAQVIENNNPDIVALQEVSRGWVISGRVDMLAWLSQRLRMPYVFGPTADPFWGNAILSRYPIMAYTRNDLPPRNLLILRGFTIALIDLGNGDKLKVIVTHFHNANGATDIRQLQSKAIINFWASMNRTALLGDLNAEPNEPEMLMLQNAGLQNAAAAMQSTPVYTFPSDNAHKQLDYIWISPDLSVKEVSIPASTASDHLPVIATITK
jgi:endonuclease/exonuclease/phosphatase family metal-dependent hydrolase